MDTFVLAEVAGQSAENLETVEAYLPDYRQEQVRGENFPIIISTPGDRVEGKVISGLTDNAMQRIRFFEGDEYELSDIKVRLNDESLVEACYFRDVGVYDTAGSAWDLAKWQSDERSEFLVRTARYMTLYGSMTTTEADQYW